jgi:TRAP-type C4-dicarboxylate transport system permease small subunit
MRRAIDYYYRFLKLVLTILMFLLMVPVTLQIFSSYMGSIPFIGTYVDIPRYIWTEEMARFCFIWIILVGSMIAVRDGTHFTVDLLPPTVSKRTEAVRNLFVDLCIFVAAVVFVLWGEHFVASSLQQTSEMADMPMVFIYIAWPLAGASYILFLIEKTVDNVKLFRSAQ